MTRDGVLSEIADRLVSLDLGHPVRVGIDGVCGAGKTTFAADLAAELRGRGAAVIALDSDGFHHRAARRRRRTDDPARGYFEDAYDFDTLAQRVLEPLGPGGDLRYATRVHDLVTDEVVDDAWATADPAAIAILDCTFLHRRDLRHLWDVVVFLEVGEAVATERGVARDRDALGGDAAARQAYELRYQAACRIYLAEERPAEAAHAVVDHDDPARPTLRWNHEPS